jgi:hypothetical protein
LREEAAVTAFWPPVPALPTTTHTEVGPHLEARGEVEEEMGEAIITTIILVVVICLIPLAVILVRMGRRSRLVLTKVFFVLFRRD